MVLALNPPKALPLLPAPDENAYNISENPCGPLFNMLDKP